MENKKAEKEKLYFGFRDGLEKSGIKYFLLIGAYICPFPPMSYYTKTISLLSYIALTAITTLLIGTIFNNIDDVLRLSECLAYLGITLPLLVCFSLLKTYKSLTEKLFIIISEDFFTYEYDDDSEFVKIKKENKVLFLRIQKIFEYLVIPSFCMWVIVAPNLERIFDDGTVKINPNMVYYLPADLWSPFDSNDQTLYYCLYILEAIVGCLLVFCLVGYGLTIVCLCLQIATQLNILQKSLLSLEIRAQKIYIKNHINSGKALESFSSELSHLHNQHDFHVCLQFCFKQNMHHYEKIEEFFNLFQQYITYITLSIFAATSLVLCNFAFIMTKTIDFATTVKFGSMFVAGTVHLLFYCACGSLIIMKSEELRDTVYFTSWTDFPEPLKRSIRIFQIKTSIYFEMKAGIFPINLKTFVEIMRTAYSIFNIIKTSEENMIRK